MIKMESDLIELTAKEGEEAIDNFKLTSEITNNNESDCENLTHANTMINITSSLQCQICNNFEAATRADLLLHVDQCHNSSMPESEHANLENSVVDFSNQNTEKQQQNISRKAFECDVCNMKFSNGANMRRHKMRHTGVKPYECRICQKRFFRKDHLAEHFTTHTKTLPYHCPICNRGFQRQIAMRAHFQNEHVGQHDLVKTCPLCTYRAGSMKSLRIHFFNRHGVDLDSAGSGETTSLILAFESKPVKPITLTNTIFSPNNSASLNSSAFSGNGDTENISYKGSATPPMHLLTPHIEISLPENEDNLNESFEAKSCFTVTEKSSGGGQVETPSPIAIADSRSSAMHHTQSINQTRIFHQPTMVSKNPILKSSTPFSATTSPDIHESKGNTPSVSIIPIKQECSNDAILFQNICSHGKNTENGCESTSEPLYDKSASVIKVSPLKSLLREDLKRRIYDRASHRTEKGLLLEYTKITNTARPNVLCNSAIVCNGTITSNENSTNISLSKRKFLLTCLFCEIEFPDETLYFLHKGCHSECNPWKCNICGEQCNSVYEFNSHLLSKSHQ